MALAEVSIVENEIVIEVGGTALLAPLVASAAASAAAASGFKDDAESAAGTAATDAAAAVAAALAADLAASQAAKTGAEAAATTAAASAASVSGIVGALSSTKEYGRPSATPPAVGGLLSGRTFVMKRQLEVGGPLSLKIYGQGAATVKFHLFTGAPGSLVEVGTEASFAIVAGLQTIDPGRTGVAGQYWGLTVPNNKTYYTAVTADDGGYYFGADITAAKAATTLQTGTRLEVSLTQSYQYTTATRDAAQDAAITALQGTSTSRTALLAALNAGLVTQVIGAQGAIQTTGSSSGMITYVVFDPAIGDADEVTVDIGASSTGTLHVKVFD
ncbi:MAG: hypothetical protein ACOH2M_24260, partial [Cypionkella sp.]